MASESENPKGYSDTDTEKASAPNHNVATKLDHTQANAKPPYSAFSSGRQRLVLGIVTAAGFFGPLAGGIYLPALPTLQHAFSTSTTAINATVSVFMGVLAVAVCPNHNVPRIITKITLCQVNPARLDTLAKYLLTGRVASILGFSSRLRWPQAALHDLAHNIHRRKHPLSSGSARSSCSVHPEDRARFRCRQRPIFRRRHGGRHHGAQETSVVDVDRAARPAAGTCAGAATWRCYHRKCKLAVDIWISRYDIPVHSFAFPRKNPSLTKLLCIISDYLFRCICDTAVLSSRNPEIGRWEWQCLQRYPLDHEAKMATGPCGRPGEIS